MRVAFVGKGGSGKSALAGTFARLLARRGHDVLAVDSDPVPGLAISIGLPPSDAGIPDDAVEERPDGQPGPRFRLRSGFDPIAAVERYAVTGPDGVRFLQFGKPRPARAPLVRSQFAFRAIVDGLASTAWNLVGDLPGGTRQPFFGWAGYADTVLVVVEPTAKSVLTARRLARLHGRGGPPEVLAVVNKVTAADDPAEVARRSGLAVAAVVPDDEAVREADRRGVALVDGAPGSDAVAAVASLVDRMDEGDRR